jgi:hypothetical protein
MREVSIVANDFTGNRRVSRKIGWIGSRLILLYAPAAALAANNCPWMNEATASGLLGGNAVGTYTSSTANQPALCTFTQSEGGVTRVLRITVDLAKDDPHAHLMKSEAECGPTQMPLKAIGNEAVACSVDEGTEGGGERAAGRVRDQVFEILITTTRKDDPILTRDALRIRINTAAEQVSGNLF